MKMICPQKTCSAYSGEWWACAHTKEHKKNKRCGAVYDCCPACVPVKKEVSDVVDKRRS
jgi:hypothetical protein